MALVCLDSDGTDGHQVIECDVNTWYFIRLHDIEMTSWYTELTSCYDWVDVTLLLKWRRDTIEMTSWCCWGDVMVLRYLRTHRKSMGRKNCRIYTYKPLVGVEGKKLRKFYVQTLPNVGNRGFARLFTYKPVRVDGRKIVDITYTPLIIYKQLFL